MESVIGKAKRSVDSTVDAYMGRAAFAASILGAVAFTLAGTWIALLDGYGPVVACFSLAAILVLISLVVHATVVARERAAARDIKAVERSIEKNGFAMAAGLPFDLSTALTLLPLVLPLLRTLRQVLPLLVVAGLAVGYVVATAQPAAGKHEPIQS